jgi:hypothetical protein
MSIHDETAQAIEANEPGYAQMARGDNIHDIVSWHGHTFTEAMPSTWTVAEARAAFIDAWANGKARVTEGTFTNDQIRQRAEQWEHGHGPHIRRSFKDPTFAEQIRVLIAVVSAGHVSISGRADFDLAGDPTTKP